MPNWKSINTAVLLLSIILTAWASVSMNQAVTWDLKNYHLYSGYSFLHKPMDYDFAPAQVQSFFNPLLHVPTYIVFKTLPGKASLALIGAVQGLNFFLLFLISQNLFLFLKKPLRTILSLCCAFTGFYGAANLGELGTTFADNIVSILVLSGLLLLIRHLLRDKAAQPGSRRPLVISGILIGIAFGLKLNVAPFVFASMAGFFAATVLRREGFRPILLFSAGISIAFVCVYGFWGGFLFLHYGNPFFPYFNQFFRSPYYDLSSASDTRFLPRSWLQILFYPFFLAHRNNLACEVTFRDVRFAFCYVAVVLLGLFLLYRLLTGKKSPEQGPDAPKGACLLFLVVFSVVSYISWQKLFSIYRYLIALEFLAPILISVILFFILRKPFFAFSSSLLLNALILNSVVPIELGERNASFDSLKFNGPSLKGLEKSAVLMTGFEPTSYVALQFPDSTRFVRISSNFTQPGRNRLADARVRQTVAEYGPSRVLAYFANRDEIQKGQQELSYYGVDTNMQSCIELRSSAQLHGLLCRMLDKRKAAENVESRTIQSPSIPTPAPIPNPSIPIRLIVTPKIVTAGKDRISYQIIGMRPAAIDMLYTVNGHQRPPIRNWRLDSDGRLSVFVGSDSEKGIYQIIGIRDTAGYGDWIKVDAAAEIK